MCLRSAWGLLEICWDASDNSKICWTNIVSTHIWESNTIGLQIELGGFINFVTEGVKNCFMKERGGVKNPGKLCYIILRGSSKWAEWVLDFYLNFLTSQKINKVLQKCFIYKAKSMQIAHYCQFKNIAINSRILSKFDNSDSISSKLWDWDSLVPNPSKRHTGNAEISQSSVSSE